LLHHVSEPESPIDQIELGKHEEGSLAEQGFPTKKVLNPGPKEKQKQLSPESFPGGKSPPLGEDPPLELWPAQVATR